MVTCVPGMAVAASLAWAMELMGFWIEGVFELCGGELGIWDRSSESGFWACWLWRLASGPDSLCDSNEEFGFPWTPSLDDCKFLLEWECSFCLFAEGRSRSSLFRTF